jgi:hypothetical protein
MWVDFILDTSLGGWVNLKRGLELQQIIHDKLFHIKGTEHAGIKSMYFAHTSMVIDVIAVRHFRRCGKLSGRIRTRSLREREDF